MHVPRFDCQSCGVCCCNTERNVAAETRDYIEVEKSDRLYVEERALLKEIGVRNEAGLWHLRLVGEDQRCVALDGDLMEGVACTIYKLRPGGCRKVDSGDEECLKARRRFGLPLTLEAERARVDAIE